MKPTMITTLAFIMIIQAQTSAFSQIDQHNQSQICVQNIRIFLERGLIVTTSYSEREAILPGNAPITENGLTRYPDDMFSHYPGAIFVGFHDIDIFRVIAMRREVFSVPDSEGARVLVGGFLISEARTIRIPQISDQNRTVLPSDRLKDLRAWIEFGGGIFGPQRSRFIMPFACTYLSGESIVPNNLSALTFNDEDWRGAAEFVFRNSINLNGQNLRSLIFQNLGNPGVSRPPG